MINFTTRQGEDITFFHIPKTGGTSVRQGVFGFKDYKEGWGKYNSYAYNDEKGSFADHFPYAVAKRRGYKINNRCIAFVRNPWHRCISTYMHLLSEPFFVWSIPKDMSFEQWIKERWIADECDEWRPGGWHQQYEYLTDDTGDIAVSDIHRIEDIDIYAIFEDFLGCEINRKRYNSSDYRSSSILLKGDNGKSQDYRSFYDASLVEEVANIYKKDIQLFNYTFE